MEDNRFMFSCSDLRKRRISLGFLSQFPGTYGIHALTGGHGRWNNRYSSWRNRYRNQSRVGLEKSMRSWNQTRWVKVHVCGVWWNWEMCVVIEKRRRWSGSCINKSSFHRWILRERKFVVGWKRLDSRRVRTVSVLNGKVFEGKRIMSLCTFQCALRASPVKRCFAGILFWWRWLLQRACIRNYEQAKHSRNTALKVQVIISNYSFSLLPS